MNKLLLLKSTLMCMIDRIDSGNSNLTEEELDETIDYLNKLTNTENKLSKYQACKYLNVSRSTFDNLVKEGKIPEGRKEQGFKEKFYLKSDLLKIKNPRSK